MHLFECGIQKLFSVHLLRVSAAPPFFRTTSLICILTSTDPKALLIGQAISKVDPLPIVPIYNSVKFVQELVKGANKNKKQCKKAKRYIRDIHGAYKDAMLNPLELSQRSK